jgi:hypothetical protein
VPNIDFYAAGEDFVAILAYVFERSGCRVFESYSSPGQDLAEFNSIADLSARYEIGVCGGSAESVLLQLVAPSGSNEFRIERIALDHGQTFRHAIVGWGLIQLYLGGTGPNGLVVSHSNHNSESRARKWAATHPELGEVGRWNWPEITAVSSAFGRYVRTKLTVYKLADRPVLPGAAAAFASGVSPHEVYFENLLNERWAHSPNLPT